METYKGAVLLIANPAAQNGNGAKAADFAARLLRSRLGKDAVELVYTTGPLHASEIARTAKGCSTVLALGGDGVVHEVACGLMQRPFDKRPALGVIAVGSGNDYARTLGLSHKVDKACEQLLSAQPQLVDIGRVNDCYFLETLSFGLDAAIAHDTVERRARTGRTGTILYMESGFNELVHHLDVYNYHALYDGVTQDLAQSITFAVQIGPYYGSGFKICPDARIDDGLLDVCIAHPPVSIAFAMFVFLCAKSGKHTRFKQIELRRCRTLHIRFDCNVPAQVDGERLEGSTFDVSIEPRALKVLKPA